MFRSIVTMATARRAPSGLIRTETERGHESLADLLIDGRWVPSATGRTREIRCPADGALVAVVDEAGATTPWRRSRRPVGPSTRAPGRTRRHRAVGAARPARRHPRARGARRWRGPSPSTRASASSRRATTSPTSCAASATSPGVAQGLSGRVVETGDAGILSRIVYEPVGVCGLITPWNYPLLQASWKVGPALAAGNTFVIKPSELTPSTTILLMRYLQEAGPARTASATSCSASARRRVRRSASTPTSTSSRSPAGCSPAGGSWRPRRDREEGRPRARREEPEHRLRGRRPRGGARQRAHRRLPALRAGVLGGSPPDRRGVHPRRLRRRDRRARADSSAWVVRSTTSAETGTLISAAHRDKVQRVRGRGASPRARSCGAGGRRPRTPPSPAATTSCRRSSTDARRRWDASRTSPSGRC